jgi:hypothetical protein
MILNRSFKLTAELALALSAVCFTAHLASAQVGDAAYKSNFTLPFEARWGHVVLPPGDYSFTVDLCHGRRRSHDQSGENRGSYDPGLRPLPGGQRPATCRAQRTGSCPQRGKYAVRALRLADVGLTLEYAVPRVEKQLVLEASQAPVARGIPVMTDGK